MINKYSNTIITVIALLLCITIVIYLSGRKETGIEDQYTSFSGERALEHVAFQVAAGPRVPGSQSHDSIVQWITEQLQANGWNVDLQDNKVMGHDIRNIIGRKGEGHPWVILGAHYDSRMMADHDPDPDFHATPVPGANDGASGAAVLVEIGRVFPEIMHTSWAQQIWLVFFDAEDNGRIPGWDWILGSRVLAESLEETPDAVVIIDMIGDRDLNIYREGSSNPKLTDEIWNVAAELGYSDTFIPKQKYNIIDDHTPFLSRGIPAVDIIDFDYPYYHTVSDTTDKVSAQSLQIIGDVLLTWLSKPR